MFRLMPDRYRRGLLGAPRTYYFSVGDHKYTVRLTPQECKVEAGKTVDRADVVLKTTPALFDKVVVQGKLPGPLDIARGSFKTNDPAKLQELRSLFDFSPPG
jgi:long-chain acyl-CoA synthetase